MRMGQGVRTGIGHGGITCVLQTQFSSFFSFLDSLCILCLKELIWAMATFFHFFWPWENNLGHGIFFVGHGRKSGHGRKKCCPWEKW